MIKSWNGLVQINLALLYFIYVYNYARPHQRFEDKTRAEVWHNKNIYHQHHNKVSWFENWEDVLAIIFQLPNPNKKARKCGPLLQHLLALYAKRMTQHDSLSTVRAG